MSKTLLRFSCLLAILCLLSPSAWAQFNGLKENPRVFNDFPASTLTITNSNSVPGNVTIDDRDMAGAGFANRHDVMLSADMGATAYNFNIDEPFTISANVTLSVGANAPRKEAGFRINSPVTGDALFLLNSDAGEIVAFGGGAPFFLFASNGLGNGYVPGTTLLMGMKYTPGSPMTTGATPATIEYFIDRGMGVVSSGALDWSNLEGGPVNFQVGVYGQVSPATPSDFITAQFSNLDAFIPEPASLGVLSLGGVLLLARRRGVKIE